MVPFPEFLIASQFFLAIPAVLRIPQRNVSAMGGDLEPVAALGKLALPSGENEKQAG
jgi:hypothetical protein|tara:strand:+ start:305 stop:475 length:171 start_codon:yes stop_codon:yes gene_type:complete